MAEERKTASARGPLWHPAVALQVGMNRVRKFVWSRMSPMQKARYLIRSAARKVGLAR